MAYGRLGWLHSGGYLRQEDRSASPSPVICVLHHQLFEAVEILARREGFPEWEALLERANKAEVVACARKYLATSARPGAAQP